MSDDWLLLLFTPAYQVLHQLIRYCISLSGIAWANNVLHHLYFTIASETKEASFSSLTFSMATEMCKIGISLGEECHKRTHCRKTGFIKISALESDDRRILSWRCGMFFDEADQICLHHEKVYVTRFESLQKSCADPQRRHKQLIRSK